MKVLLKTFFFLCLALDLSLSGLIPCLCDLAAKPKVHQCCAKKADIEKSQHSANPVHLTKSCCGHTQQNSVVVLNSQENRHDFFSTPLLLQSRIAMAVAVPQPALRSQDFDQNKVLVLFSPILQKNSFLI